MIVELLGSKGQLVREAGTNRRLVQFDDNGRAVVSNVSFDMVTWDKLLKGFKHIVLDKSDEDIKLEKIKAERLKVVAKEVKKAEPKVESPKADLDEEAIRAKAKELKIRNWHNMNLDKLADKIKGEK